MILGLNVAGIILLGKKLWALALGAAMVLAKARIREHGIIRQQTEKVHLGLVVLAMGS